MNQSRRRKRRRRASPLTKAETCYKTPTVNGYVYLGKSGLALTWSCSGRVMVFYLHTGVFSLLFVVFFFGILGYNHKSTNRISPVVGLGDERPENMKINRYQWLQEHLTLQPLFLELLLVITHIPALVRLRLGMCDYVNLIDLKFDENVTRTCECSIYSICAC